MNAGHGDAKTPLTVRGPALFYCRTPLQSMIARRLVARVEGVSVVLYHANTVSPKHRAYFEEMTGDELHFVPYEPLEISDTLGEVLTWPRLPASIRRRRFASMFVASMGSIPFGMLAVRNSDAELFTYDDGTFNLCEHVYAPWIANEPAARRVVKRLLRGGSNPDIASRARAHFTIFPPRFVVGSHRQIEEVDVFDAPRREAGARRRRVRLLLGAWSADPVRQRMHDDIVRSGRFDLFLPHPADARPATCAPWLSSRIDTSTLHRKIAEDVVRVLWAAGLQPVVYGFETTALYNVAAHTVAISFLLGEAPAIVPAGVAKALRVRQLRCSRGDAQVAKIKATSGPATAG